MEANTNSAPQDITQIRHQTSALTGLLMSANKAFVSKHNFSPVTSWTSVRPSLLTYFAGLGNLSFQPRATEAGRQQEWKTGRRLCILEKVKHEWRFGSSQVSVCLWYIIKNKETSTSEGLNVQRRLITYFQTIDHSTRKKKTDKKQKKKTTK